jgi:hypothetical protein
MRKQQRGVRNDLSDWIVIGVIALITGATVWVPILAAKF